MIPRMRAALRGQLRLSTSNQRCMASSSASGASSTSVSASASPSGHAEASNLATTHYRVTLRRSAIGLPKEVSLVLESLGLRKRLQSVFKPHHPKYAGMILAVKELVHVDNVRRLDGGMQDAAMVMAERIRQKMEEDPAATDIDEVAPLTVRNQHAIWVNEKGEVVDWGGRPSRKAPRGYTVVGNVVNEQRHRQIQAERANVAA